jgi:hypothetical protein
MSICTSNCQLSMPDISICMRDSQKLQSANKLISVPQTETTSCHKIIPGTFTEAGFRRCLRPIKISCVEETGSGDSGVLVFSAFTYRNWKLRKSRGFNRDSKWTLHNYFTLYISIFDKTHSSEYFLKTLGRFPADLLNCTYCNILYSTTVLVIVVVVE